MIAIVPEWLARAYGIKAIYFQLTYVLLLSLAIGQPTLGQGSNNMLLKGNVNAEDYLPKNDAPSLSRKDINKLDDPFGNNTNQGPVEQAIEPPADAFEMRSMKLPPRTAGTLSGQTAKNTIPDANFQGVNMPGLTDQDEQPSTAMATPPFNLNAGQDDQNLPPAVEPDNTPEMQLAWDQWHRQVALEIYNRFNTMSQFTFKHSKPLAAYVSYTVTRDGRITNVRLLQKSPNVAFNAMLLLVVNSLSGQTDLLRFPPGSRRMSVEKAGMFTQNYGVQGFKYTVGDRETIRKN